MGVGRVCVCARGVGGSWGFARIGCEERKLAPVRDAGTRTARARLGAPFSATHHVRGVGHGLGQRARARLGEQRRNPYCAAHATGAPKPSPAPAAGRRRLLCVPRRVQLCVQGHAEGARVLLNRFVHLVADALLHAKHVHVKTQRHKGCQHACRGVRVRGEVAQLHKRVPRAHVPRAHPQLHLAQHLCGRARATRVQSSRRGGATA